MNVAAKRRTRDGLIEQYRDYVRGVAGRLIRALHLPADLFDECVAAGHLGLVEAAERFDFKGGAAFKTFAYLRIRGAIVDSLRANAGVSAQAYRMLKTLEAAQQLREAEAARGQEGDLSGVFELTAKSILIHRLSLYESIEEVNTLEDPATSPEDLLAQKQDRVLLREFLDRLTQKERQIIHKYYFEKKTFLQIAKECGGSKSWICRQHARVIEKLRYLYFEA